MNNLINSRKKNTFILRQSKFFLTELQLIVGAATTFAFAVDEKLM